MLAINILDIYSIVVCFFVKREREIIKSEFANLNNEDVFYHFFTDHHHHPPFLSPLLRYNINDSCYLHQITKTYCFFFN